MKRNLILLLVLLVAPLFTSCTIRYHRAGEGGVASGPMGHPGHAQPTQGGRRPDGQYTKSTYIVGTETHGYRPQVQVSSYNGALSTAEKDALKEELDAWAIKRVDAKRPPPTDEELTEEAKHRVGHDRVRARAGNTFENTRTSVPRQLVKKEAVSPQSLTAAQRQEAQRRFYENQRLRTQ